MAFNILVIDDSLTVRAIIEELLGAQKDMHVVGSAASVPAARELIGRFVPSIIILDLAMPGVDGFAFLDELAGHPHAPVLVVSSHTVAGSPSEAEAIERGAFACFDKAQLLRQGGRFTKLVRQALASATAPARIDRAAA
jgi:two-component system chemotaxis response regulator CheB